MAQGYSVDELAQALIQRGGYNSTDAYSAARNAGGRADSLAREFLNKGPDVAKQETNQLVQEIINVINEYESKLAKLGVPALTDAEMDAFLQKAIAQVKPYYEKKIAEIEAGIKEGRVRSSEDLLIEIRDIRANIEEQLKGFDIEQAETEEDLINTLADITSTKTEALETKKIEWRDRIREKKQTQVQTGVLTSGIGRKKVQEALQRGEEEKATIERRAGTLTEEAETAAEYDISKVTLARKSAQRERVRKLGTAEEEARTEAEALGELGYTEGGKLPSTAEIEQARIERNISVYRPEALTEITEEEKKAIESRKLTFQSEELAQRKEKESAERRVIEAEIAKKKRQAAQYGTFL